ncbi:hypothetical protein [Pseudoalteromonas luteoviolacea]|uniref:Uncharacterized protein n=1 Tax=Pseudoalteromonas luteoviolacea H33 TaxID=1365251 RepID=A0A167AD08_9GAMM|nr:hypothetical protein [Pseudoalteromonas luteoviolacea]KZN45244.1 hypothetical protein N476_04335 [Pseudoalteromonas luteoviolacea H33]KZN70892.1 hypothetical protein N477_05705 [Pseudoalteromonas luteoviolacea H33-S]
MQQQEQEHAPSFQNYPTRTALSVSNALQSDSVSVDLLSSGVDVAKRYASQVVWDHFNGDATAKLIISSVFNYAVTSLKSLNPWVTAIAQALLLLAKVPPGVVSAVLWAVGKIWLWVANKFYNGGWIAAAWGDIDEPYIYQWLKKGSDAHGALRALVDNLQDWVKYIQDKLNSRVARLIGVAESNSEEEQSNQQQAQQGAQESSPNLVDNKFISLGINQPELMDWEDGASKPKRAGLHGTGVAKVNLLGQQFGGDIDIKLPFGSGWEVAVSPVFASQQGVGFSGYIEAHQVLGDELVINEAGLARFKASIVGLNIANKRVYSDLMSLDYNKQQKEVHFAGDAHVPLWNKKKLDGEFDLKMDTAGKFKSGRTKVSSKDTFEVIPKFLSISNPSGEVEVKEDASPEFEVGTDVSLYGLPGGVKASVTQAKVMYHDEQLGGEIEQADVEIPISKHTTMTLAMTKAKFTKDAIEAENAFMDLEHDNSKVLNETAIVESDFFSGNFDFSKVFELKQLKVHQGLNSLKFAGGKFTYEKDENNGLQLLRARILGLEAYYDREKREGGISGEWHKGISFPAFSLDFPVGAGVAGVGVDITGGFDFGAGIGATLKNDEKDNTDTQMLFSVSGEASASAKAKARIEAGAFVGVPYLAKVQAGVFGEIRGGVAGKVNTTGRLKYTRGKGGDSFGQFAIDSYIPMKGDFSLKGSLEAEVGASIKAKVLTFEKEIASVSIGDWTLGEYTLNGTIKKDPNGKGYIVERSKSEFTKGKPEPAQVTKETLTVDKWVDQLEKDHTHIEYTEDEAKRKLPEVARKTVYSHLSLVQKDDVSDRYKNLLKQISQQNKFVKIYRETKAGRDKLPTSGTYIWTSKVWSEAVQRKSFWIFEMSKSKAKVADKLDKYHKTNSILDRRVILAELEEIASDYRQNRSKNEDNKEAAKEFLDSIDKERLILM